MKKPDSSYGEHESYCDIRLGISLTCNCIASTYIEQIQELQMSLDKLKYAADELAYLSDAYLKQWICSPDPKPLQYHSELHSAALSDSIKKYRELITASKTLESE